MVPLKHSSLLRCMTVAEINRSVINIIIIIIIIIVIIIFVTAIIQYLSLSLLYYSRCTNLIERLKALHTIITSIQWRSHNIVSLTHRHIMQCNGDINPNRWQWKAGGRPGNNELQRLVPSYFRRTVRRYRAMHPPPSDLAAYHEACTIEDCFRSSGCRTNISYI